MERKNIWELDVDDIGNVVEVDIDGNIHKGIVDDFGEERWHFIENGEVVCEAERNVCVDESSFGGWPQRYYSQDKRIKL